MCVCVYIHKYIHTYIHDLHTHTRGFRVKGSPLTSTRMHVCMNANMHLAGESPAWESDEHLLLLRLGLGERLDAGRNIDGASAAAS